MNAGEGVKEKVTPKRPEKGAKDLKAKAEKEEPAKPEEVPELEKAEFVLPGDFVGITEEFTPGEGTYSDKGDIFSTASGNVVIDKKKRVISVVSSPGIPPVVKEGDIVVGEVTNVRDSVVLVSLAGIKGVEDREFKDPGIAAVHVSNVKQEYVKDLSREFSVSDIVKAKVLNTQNMRLDTSQKSLGVMKANCSVCRKGLVRDNNKLRCPECGNVETRKLSSDYGTGII